MRPIEIDYSTLSRGAIAMTECWEWIVAVTDWDSTPCAPCLVSYNKGDRRRCMNTCAGNNVYWKLKLYLA